MKKPLASQLWRFPFEVSATVYYITEPFPDTALTRLCLQMRLLTLNDIGNPHHFCILFPNNAVLLFFCPQKAICDGFSRGELSPELKRVRQQITNTATDLITYCTREGILRKE
jgi:hypothetical protein